MRIPDGVYVSSAHVRVGYVDTDRAQVVHHSTYLRYLEMARVEYLRQRDCDYRTLEFDRGLGLAVVEATLRYRAAAGFDDELELKTWIAVANRAKLRFDSVIMRGDELLTTARATSGGQTTAPEPFRAGAYGGWIKLVRSGTTVTSYSSVDGVSWDNFKGVTLSDLGTTAQVGIAISSGQTAPSAPRRWITSSFSPTSSTSGGTEASDSAVARLLPDPAGALNAFNRSGCCRSTARLCDLLARPLSRPRV